MVPLFQLPHRIYNTHYLGGGIIFPRIFYPPHIVKGLVWFPYFNFPIEFIIPTTWGGGGGGGGGDKIS